MRHPRYNKGKCSVLGLANVRTECLLILLLPYAFGCTRDLLALQCLHTCDDLQACRTYRGVRLHPCQRHSLDEVYTLPRSPLLPARTTSDAAFCGGKTRSWCRHD